MVLLSWLQHTGPEVGTRLSADILTCYVWAATIDYVCAEAEKSPLERKSKRERAGQRDAEVSISRGPQMDGD